MPNQEYIVCAANYYDDGKKHVHQPVNLGTGFIVCGLRHCNCYNTYAAIAKDYSGANETESGFLTSKNRFVNRQEAYYIAEAAKQIINPNPEKGRLFSEDLY